MGARDHPPLPEDAVPAGGHADRSEGWRRDSGEARQEQAEAHHVRAGWEARQRAEGRQVCRMLGTHTGKDIFELSWIFLVLGVIGPVWRFLMEVFI